MLKKIRALIVEDSEEDAMLLALQLKRDGYNVTSTRVDTAPALGTALNELWDIVISDYVIPGFGGLQALKLLQEKGLDIPFILISSKIGEETSVAMMKAGASDVVMKDNLKRLAPVIERELQEARNRLEKRQAEAALRKSEVELRALSRKLVAVQENERQTIARELHDQIGQSLTVLKLLLARAERTCGSPAAPLLSEAQSTLSELIGQVREISLNLRPSMLDDLGLMATLLWHIQSFAARTGIKVDFKHSGIDRTFPSDIGTAVYRIVQESLTNVARHSGAREVDVRCWASDSVMRVFIADRGSGFDPSAPAPGTSAGLSGMRERVLLLNGIINIKASPGVGTEITVELPLSVGVDEVETK